MRIVSGRYRGKLIATPPGSATRPTSDRVRQAVFNILEHAPWSPGLIDARVLDLFSGSGALGLEAVSRGAAYCLFVETNEAARGAIRDNIEAFSLFGESRVHRRDATDLGLRQGSVGPHYDLVFLDPPYRQGLGETALASLLAGDWLTPSAICVFERGSDEADPRLPSYDLLDGRVYGAAKVLFMKRSAPAEA